MTKPGVRLSILFDRLSDFASAIDTDSVPSDESIDALDVLAEILPAVHLTPGDKFRLRHNRHFLLSEPMIRDLSRRQVEEMLHSQIYSLASVSKLPDNIRELLKGIFIKLASYIVDTHLPVKECGYADATSAYVKQEIAQLWSEAVAYWYSHMIQSPDELEMDTVNRVAEWAAGLPSHYS